MPLAKIGTIPGYTKAVATYKPSAATIKAVAPTQLQKNALGPKFGGNYAAGNQAIPSYLLPAPKLPPSTVPSNYQPNIDEILGAPLSEQARGSYNTNLQSLMNALRSNLGGAVIKSGYDPTAA